MPATNNRAENENVTKLFRLRSFPSLAGKRNMTILATFAVALILSLFATRLVRQFAPRFGLVDPPDGVRKLQRVPIPVGGGLAVFFAMLASVLIALTLDTRVALAFVERYPQWIALGIAGAIIVIVGLIDDCVALRPTITIIAPAMPNAIHCG